MEKIIDLQSIEPVQETLQVPAYLTIKDVRLDGQINVSFVGHEVGHTFWQRVKTAWFVLTGRAKRLYSAETLIVGCIITTNPDSEASGITIGSGVSREDGNRTIGDEVRG